MDNLGDLNTHLFDQLNRLNAEDLKGEELKEEINRAKAVSDISRQIIDNGRLVLEAAKFKDDRFDIDRELPMLSDGNE